MTAGIQRPKWRRRAQITPKRGKKLRLGDSGQNSDILPGSRPEK